MSLHAVTSIEANDRLIAQRRLASITSLIIALLLSTLIGVILYIISMAVETNEIDGPIMHSQPSEEEEVLEAKKVSTNVKRKPTPPSGGSPAPVIASSTPSLISIPVDQLQNESPSQGFDDDFGIAFDTGQTGASEGSIPTGTFKKRCGQAERMERLLSAGGTESCEDATMKALRWLSKEQNNDGSWDRKHQVAMTGLALLAYLGHCETVLSEEFGENVFAATTFLVNKSISNKGRLASDLKAHWCYEHAIATYALCESHSLSKVFGYQIPKLEEATRNSVQWIINNQNEIGGWNYRYEEHSRWDTSINAWHLQALKAAELTGLEFRNLKRCKKAALAAIIDTQKEHGGFGYSRSGPTGSPDGHFTLTGAGALCVQQHRGNAKAEARKGIAYLNEHASFDWQKKANLYEHYYASQAMINAGGKPWESYNKLFRDQLLKNQNKDGSWSGAAGNKHSTGKIYDTCFATLMLEVYYRYLPTSK